MGLDEQLWPGWQSAKRLAHIYAIRCLAHRLRKFGFEESVNLLDARSLVMLAMHVHEPMATACIKRAEEIDPAISSLIRAPHV